MDKKLRSRRKRITAGTFKKTIVKFDNLRLLELHYELAMQRILRRQFDLVMHNRKMAAALKDLVQQ